jgi:putative Holliday junction resolvase
MPDTPEGHPATGQTVMAFDFGLRRLGVAVGQTLTRSASPLDTLPCRDNGPDWSAVDRVVDDWRPGQLVVGLPLRADDSDSDLTRAARTFAADLESRYARPVALQDERLSSSEARDRLRAGRRSGALKRRGRKEDIDRLAAAVILQSWFDEKN